MRLLKLILLLVALAATGCANQLTARQKEYLTAGAAVLAIGLLATHSRSPATFGPSMGCVDRPGALCARGPYEYPR